MRNMLHQEKEFSEGLWEHAQAIILVLDVRGCIIRYNPYLEDLTGVPHREVKGLNWFDRFVPAGNGTDCAKCLRRRSAATPAPRSARC